MIISIFDWFSNLPMSCWWLFFICLWFVAAFVIFFGDKWLFGNKPVSKSDKFKYLGAFIGGTLVVLGAIFAQHQFKVQNCSKIEDQFYVRFDKASSSLFSGNSETAISLLHQLAVEASKSKDQSSYIEEIKKILIVFIKKNSIIKEDTVYNKIDKIQLQKIIDNLFRGEHHEIYSKYATDLSVTVLKDLNFLDAHLQGAIFSYAHLGRAYFVDAHLQYAIFIDAKLQGAYFNGAKLYTANFNDAQLQFAEFNGADLDKANFFEANLLSTDFSDAKNIKNALFGANIWNEFTNFSGTDFEKESKSVKLK